MGRSILILFFSFRTSEVNAWLTYWEVNFTVQYRDSGIYCNMFASFLLCSEVFQCISSSASNKVALDVLPEQSWRDMLSSVDISNPFWFFSFKLLLLVLLSLIICNYLLCNSTLSCTQVFLLGFEDTAYSIKDLPISRFCPIELKPLLGFGQYNLK